VVYVANYDTFIVGSESINYTLTVALYSGNAGDTMSYHSGMMFSTYDRDNDPHATINCANHYAGGFWYNKCYGAGVTVMRFGNDGFIWGQLPTSDNHLMSASMWVTC